ncbi:hypothetical protein SDC9_81566 [bioreactor metagenome]|uniref:Porin domain-containing protein n=1 Tax=bioreactor metagenome TaxID=1076179 RepID=A0A644Z2A5_9ZZZZ
MTGDAVKVDFGKVLKATAFYGRFDSDIEKTSVAGTDTDTDNDVAGLALSYDFSKSLYARAAYYNVSGATSPYPVVDRDIYSAGLGYKFDKNVNIYGEYMKASDELATGYDDDGYAVTLAYKGVKAAKANTWGLTASYYDQSGATIIDHASEFAGDIKNFSKGGIKGYDVAVDYAFAKNVIASVTYYDYENHENSSIDNQMLWSRLTFTF